MAIAARPSTLFPSTTPTWKGWQYAAFRVVFIYLLLFLAAQYDLLFVRTLLNAIARWFALSVLHATLPDNPLESLTDYLVIWISLGLSIIAAALWGILERPVLEKSRRITESLFWPTHTFMRYFLASMLFVYGWQKVFHLQMPAPTLSDMLVPFGEQRRMQLAWRFVGSSSLFEVVGGWAEVVPACLLLFRRTSLLGASLATVVLSFVVLLNFSFNIHVKIWSSQLFIISMLLVAPYTHNLLSLIANKTVQPILFPTPPAQNWRRWIGWAWRVVAVIYVCWSPLSWNLETKRKYELISAKSEISGLYEVVSDSRPATTRLDQDRRWRRAAFDDTKIATLLPVFFIQRVNREQLSGFYELISGKRTLTLRLSSLDGTSKVNIPMTYLRETDGFLIISGTESGQAFTVELKPASPKATRVREEKFSWVSASWLPK
ncbi:hypothetical protein [Deinococcus sp.]|uniref:hypothetical protein n=1 Tax=Deinococcus sp. TaxID=47478 RepID=UPI003CC6A270